MCASIPSRVFSHLFLLVFSGNASDRFTVEHSGFLDKLQPGQHILANRGFTACDLLARKQAFLTIASFCDQLENLAERKLYK